MCESAYAYLMNAVLTTLQFKGVPMDEAATLAHDAIVDTFKSHPELLCCAPDAAAYVRRAAINQWIDSRRKRKEEVLNHEHPSSESSPPDQAMLREYRLIISRWIRRARRRSRAIARERRYVFRTRSIREYQQRLRYSARAARKCYERCASEFCRLLDIPMELFLAFTLGGGYRRG